MLTLRNDALPTGLNQLQNPPKQLYYQGSEPVEKLLRSQLIAIVGSRKMTTYGRSVTQQISSRLASQGAVIVSGLALGTDSVAHRAALEVGGATIAVLPGPVTRVYPRSHVQLAQSIIEQGGALVSEYDEETAGPMPHHFIDRNRIIAALSSAVIIPEARQASGSLHTARFAHRLGIPIYAVPGPITSVECAGSNQLIANGIATMITSIDTVCQQLLGGTDTKQLFLPTIDDPLQQAILDQLSRGLTRSEELLLACKVSVTELDQALTQLEIFGHIQAVSGGTWRLP